jgi:glycosyltransferase involved in cell wall biosynthesis
MIVLNNNQDESVMLSVIIICHNQKDVVKRCIDSVLRQTTNFNMEVIVSDDRSTDGTREMLQDEYKDHVITTFFNSDDCNTSFTLERSGYNRLNGLKLARGKYLIHTDGDDFFTSEDLFQEMVDTLEKHPECNLCCQNYCMVNSNELDIPFSPRIKNPIMNQTGIVTAQLFFSVVQLVNACFCMRRSAFNSVNLWGGTYDDNYITARYVGNGDVAILNRYDFIYVQYGHSTCATMTASDKNIILQAAIGVAELAPSIAGAMLRLFTYSFFAVSWHYVTRKKVSREIKTFCGRFNNYIYSNLTNDFCLMKWLRYLLICVFSAFMVKTKYKPNYLLKALYKLAIDIDTPFVKI